MHKTTNFVILQIGSLASYLTDTQPLLTLLSTVIAILYTLLLIYEKLNNLKNKE